MNAIGQGMNTAAGRSWRRGLWLLVIGLPLVLAAGLHLAANALKAQVVSALGPDAEIADIGLGWFTVHVDGLRIRAPSDWPAADTLRAQRITIAPDLRSLFSDTVRIRAIRVEQPYLSIRRTADGHLQLLPGLLLQKSADDAKPGAIAVGIARIVLSDGVLEFFDASVAKPALKIRLEGLQATLGDLQLPALEDRMPLALSATVKGVQRDGSVSMSGWIHVPSQDSELKATLRGVDLVALQPYLIKTNETGVRRGALDLDLQSSVSGGRLKAPGKLLITQLQLAPARGGFNTFMGVPRQAVIAALKDRNDRIAMNFQLDGDLHNPQFSLNEVLSVRLTYGIAQSLGLGIEGLAKDAGSLGARGLDAAGSAIGNLFGLHRKRKDDGGK